MENTQLMAEYKKHMMICKRPVLPTSEFTYHTTHYVLWLEKEVEKARANSKHKNGGTEAASGAEQPQQPQGEIFESLDRLEYCSPKSEPWIAENAKFLRSEIKKLSPVR